MASHNLAREVLELRENEASATEYVEDDAQKERLRALIDMAESVGSRGADDSKRDRENDTPLLTLPTGAEVDETQGSLLDPLDTPLAPSES